MIELLYSIVKKAKDQPIPAAPASGIGAGMPLPAGGDPMQNEIALQQAGDETAKLQQDMQAQQQQSAQAIQQAEAAAAQQQQKAQEQIATQTIAAQQATANAEIEKAKLKAEVDLIKAKAKADKPTGKPQPSMFAQRLQRTVKGVQKAVKISAVAPGKRHVGYEAPKEYGFLDSLSAGLSDDSWNPRQARDAVPAAPADNGAWSARNMWNKATHGAAQAGAGVQDFANNFTRGWVKPLADFNSGVYGAASNAAGQATTKAPWDIDLKQIWNNGGSKAVAALPGAAMTPLNMTYGGLGLSAGLTAYDTGTAQSPQQPQAPAGDPWRVAQDAVAQYGPQPAAPDPYDTWQNNGLAASINGGPYAAQQWNRGMSMYPPRNYEDIGRFKTPWMENARQALPGLDQLLTGGQLTQNFRPDTDAFQNPGGHGSNSADLAQMTPQTQGIQQFLQMMAGMGQN
jgi:hypothetical protein